jgi:dipeptidyl aminopeptidase/acylaminoacyl peptidase
MKSESSFSRRFVALASSCRLRAGIVLVGTAQPSSALSSQFIVYVNTPDGGDSNVWKMNPDGSGKVQLTTTDGAQPVISPDGSKIVFTSTRDYVAPPPPPPCCYWPPCCDPVDEESNGGTEEIYVMNADGTGQTRLTSDSGRDVSPAWSPDGNKIIFMSNRTGNWQIFTIDPSGNNLTQVVSTGSNDTNPKFSPDGTKILFISTRSGKGQVWTMNADGTSPFRVTQDSYSNDYPSWSPDGTRIAFTSERLPSGPDTYTIAPDGSSPSGALTSTFTQVPQWSPDSTRIVVQSPRNGNWDIYSMKADGTDQVRLTTDSGLDQSPFWGPGVPGNLIVSSPDAPTALVVAAGDGSASVAFTPGSNGNSPITKYQYRVGAGAWSDAVGTSSPITVPGLTNYQISRIRLRAVNAVGDGAASDVIQVTPRISGSSLTSLKSQTSSRILAAFTAVTPAGGTMSHYWVSAYLKGSTTVAATCKSSAAARSCVVMGLSAATEYDVDVRGFYTLTGSTTVLQTLDSSRQTVRTKN